MYFGCPLHFGWYEKKSIIIKVHLTVFCFIQSHFCVTFDLWIPTIHLIQQKIDLKNNPLWGSRDIALCILCQIHSTLRSETFAGRKFRGSTQPRNFRISQEKTFADELFSNDSQKKNFTVDPIKNILLDNFWIYFKFFIFFLSGNYFNVS